MPLSTRPSEYHPSRSKSKYSQHQQQHTSEQLPSKVRWCLRIRWNAVIRWSRGVLEWFRFPHLDGRRQPRGASLIFHWSLTRCKVQVCTVSATELALLLRDSLDEVA